MLHALADGKSGYESVFRPLVSHKSPFSCLEIAPPFGTPTSCDQSDVGAFEVLLHRTGWQKTLGRPNHKAG